MLARCRKFRARPSFWSSNSAVLAPWGGARGRTCPWKAKDRIRMRTKLLLALTAVFAIAIASSASALLGVNTVTNKAAAPSSSSGGNGSTRGGHQPPPQNAYHRGHPELSPARPTTTDNGPGENLPAHHKQRHHT